MPKNENSRLKVKYIKKKVDIMNKRNEIPALPAVGKNMHKERRRQQLSLEALAAGSGVSKAMLSQIESGKVNPTVATLWKIAHALGVEFETLLQGEGGRAKRFELNSAERITSFTTDRSGTVFRVLSPIRMAEDLEMYLVTLQPGAEHRSQPHQDGSEEFLTMLSGEVKVTAGRNQAVLRKGDFLSYQSDVEHSISNTSGQPAELYMIVRFPQH